MFAALHANVIPKFYSKIGNIKIGALVLVPSWNLSRIGCSLDNGTDIGDFSIAEIQIYNTSLSNAEIAKIGNDLAVKCMTKHKEGEGEGGGEERRREERRKDRKEVK
jgi:hypothetical protein